MVSLDVASRSGWEVLRLSTDELRIEVVPGLGGTITSIRRASDDLELLWSTPWGLRPAGALRLPGSAEAARLETSPGGWQTICPNGSDHAIVHDVEWGYDGEARIAWLDWEQTPSSVIMKGRLTRSPLELTKIISLRRGEITVGETITNVGGEHVDVVWGQQVIFGAPVLSPTTVIDTDATTVRADPRVAPGADFDDVLPWPRTRTRSGLANLRSIPAVDAGESRSAYLSDFDQARVVLRTPELGLRLALDWDLNVWPHLWYGLEAGERDGYPWYRSGYFLSLTPATSWPARGVPDVRRTSATTLRVHPGGARTAYLSLTVDPL